MSRKKTKRELTESEWEKVFQLRVRSKRGETLAPAETALLHAAYAADPTRYSAREREIFLQSAPLGGLLFEHSIAMLPETKK